ncbi:Sulfotransferase family protein [Limimonas halophila]|uniref:Sulfotransferase family protein n=1 Tax=Limimonas halophila TaxID=1082479 RepID=A0A1G7M826_9PROT|nr:sulfotransferase [Limimonas halophila]SDF57903.1 Sulfotransferase family protein [Limimonas halophila]
MTLSLRHGAHLGGRVLHETATTLRHAVPGLVRTPFCGGGELVRAQAQLIRHVAAFRESTTAYARLRRLIARHGDAGLDLAPDPPRPERFVVFIGQSRSGHSLVGSLLDAHPEIAIAHEMHALKHLAAGAAFDDVLAAAALNAQIFQRLGRSYTGYDYAVAGQHQGTWTLLVAAGDKKGNGSTRVLQRRPDAVAAAEARLPVPVCYVNVVRDPWDNVATKALRTGRPVTEAARIFTANARTIAELTERAPERVSTLHLDQLIAEPAPVLRQLIAFLGASAPERAYLDACAALLFTKPSRTRERVTWSAEAVAELDAACRDIPFLQRYARGAEADSAPA